MEIDAKFDGQDRLKSEMQAIGSRIPGRVYQAMLQACALVEIKAKTHHLAGATLQPRTRFLQRSVKSDVRQTGDTVSGRIGSPLVYAAIHEFGGIIKPKNAQFLVFQIDGQWIRTKQVTIPKREWLSKSLEDVKGQIERLFGREIEMAIS